MNRFLFFATSLFFVLHFAACENSDGSEIPEISIAATDEWCDGDLRALAGRVEPNGAEIEDVYVLYARNEFPSDPGDAQRTDPLESIGTAYTFNVPETFAIAEAQLVWYQLVIVYTNSLASGSQTMTTSLKSTRYCCNGQTLKFWLEQDQQDIVARFGVLDKWPGWPGKVIGNDNDYKYVAAHGKCCYRGMGVAIARAEDDHHLILGYPNVLFYEPSDKSGDLCDQQQDGTYSLIGWAYTQAYCPNERPDLNKCLPFEGWFVHEAGYHYLNSGVFCPTPPDEDSPGEKSLVTKCEDHDCDGPCLEKSDVERIDGCSCSGCLRQWHERMLDIHIWRNDGGTPTISLEHPSGPEGCTDTLPAGSFFSPTLMP